MKDKPRKPKRPRQPVGSRGRAAGGAKAPKGAAPTDAPGAKRPHMSGKHFGSRSTRPPAGQPERQGGLRQKPAGGTASAQRSPSPDTPSPGERIARRLARAGLASRREAEALIAAGRVKVNGEVLKSPAFNVRADDTILVDDTEIPTVERTRLFLFHKPAGVVTTSRDPEGRKTVFDVLPAGLPRLMTIGRLDINTEGLLLLTNDGGLARLLELPSTGWLRRYRVRVHGGVDEQALADLKNGIAVEGVFYGAIEASLERVQGSNAWLSLGLREGKNREVRTVLGALGLDVTRLIRVSFGPFQLADLPEGAVRELRGRTLRDQLGQRLIEAAGANFDAPVTRPFSSGPTLRREKTGKDEPARTPAGPPWRDERKRVRERRREDALERLQTRPGRPAGSRDKEHPRDPPARSRASNVWMAPGSRPMGTKPATPQDRSGAQAARPRQQPGPRGARPGSPSSGVKGRPGKPRGGK